MRAWYAVVMISLVSIFAWLDRGTITLLVTPIKQDLHLTDTQVSLLIGLAFSLSYVFGSVPLAQLADNWSRKRVLSLALIVWSLATAASGLAQNFVQFFVLRSVVGAGEGVKSPGSTSMIADFVPREHLPRAYAVFNMFTNAGAALALIIGGALLALLRDVPDIELPGIGPLRDWQMIFVIVGLPGILFALWLLATVPETLAGGRGEAGSAAKASMFDVLRHMIAHRQIFGLMLLLSSLYSIVGGSQNGWRPAFFERTYGWSPEHTGALLGSTYLAATMVALVVGTVVTEHLAKRYADANLRIVMFAYGLGMPICAASTLVSDGNLAIALITISTTLTVSSAPAQIAALQVVTPGNMRSQVAAYYFIAMNVVGSGGGPLLVALLTDDVFGSESMLRYSMSIVVALMIPSGLLVNWLILKPYARYVGMAPVG